MKALLFVGGPADSKLLAVRDGESIMRVFRDPGPRSAFMSGEWSDEAMRARLSHEETIYHRTNYYSETLAREVPVMVADGTPLTTDGDVLLDLLQFSGSECRASAGTEVPRPDADRLTRERLDAILGSLGAGAANVANTVNTAASGLARDWSFWEEANRQFPGTMAPNFPAQDESPFPWDAGGEGLVQGGPFVGVDFANQGIFDHGLTPEAFMEGMATTMPIVTGEVRPLDSESKPPDNPYRKRKRKIGL